MKKEYFLHGAILCLVFAVFISSYIDTREPRILLIIAITTAFGFGTWALGYKVTPMLTRLFFRIQKFSWLHLIFKPKILEDERYFLSHATRNSIGSLFLLWIGSWALVVFLAHHITETLSVTGLIESGYALSEAFQVLMIGWLLTPLVAFIVLPISVIESSNLRILLKTKSVIISPTTPFRYIVGGFATISVLLTDLRGLEMAELITSILFLPAPFYIMTLLHRLRSEKFLIADFKSYLRKRGISEKEINLS